MSEKYPDDISRTFNLNQDDIKYLRSLYNEDWTPSAPTEIVFPSGTTVPRKSIIDFVDFKTVKGIAGWGKK